MSLFIQRLKPYKLSVQYLPEKSSDRFSYQASRSSKQTERRLQDSACANFGSHTAGVSVVMENNILYVSLSVAHSVCQFSLQKLGNHLTSTERMSDVPDYVLSISDYVLSNST